MASLWVGSCRGCSRRQIESLGAHAGVAAQRLVACAQPRVRAAPAPRRQASLQRRVAATVARGASMRVYRPYSSAMQRAYHACSACVRWRCARRLGCGGVAPCTACNGRGAMNWLQRRGIHSSVDSIQRRLAQVAPVVEKARSVVARLHAQVMDPALWDHPQRARVVTAQHHAATQLIADFDGAADEAASVGELYDLAVSEGDADMMQECEAAVDELQQRVQRLVLETLLQDPADSGACVIELHAGSGGTDSYDWAGMLLRMYQGWADSRGYQVSEVEKSEASGSPIALRHASMTVSGHNAFGFLKTEAGVHRLVRLSPFDTAARRHTSFARVCVFPYDEGGDDAAEDLDMGEVHVETFRSSGPGGQHVNTTDSAVRVVHLPTGTTAACQSDRSQHRNKASALNLLRAKLAAQRMADEGRMHAEFVASLGPNAWGSQIRSYTLHPYRLVKDHRTGVELAGDVDGLLERGAGLTPFMEAALALGSDTDADQS